MPDDVRPFISYEESRQVEGLEDLVQVQRPLGRQVRPPVRRRANDDAVKGSAEYLQLLRPLAAA